jgi:hypothetical protein
MDTSIHSIVASRLIQDRIAAATAEHQARELRPRRRREPGQSAVQAWLHREPIVPTPQVRRHRVQ